MNRRRTGLFLKYFAFIGLLVSVGLVASGAIGLYFSYQESRDALVSLQREKALTASVRIEQFLREVENQMGWTALPLVTPGQSPTEHRRLDYLKLIRQAPAITEVSYLDANGHEQLKVSRLAMDTAGSNVDFSKDPRFVEARKGKTWFGPVYFRRETEPYMTIAIPEAPDRPGVTAVDVNLKFIWDVVSRIRIGQKGLAYVVDDKGFLVAHPDISLVLKKVNLSDLPQVKAALAAGPDAQFQEAQDARDPAGVRVFSAFSRVAPTGWRVFVEEPVTEVFTPLYDAILRTVFLLVAGMVLSVIASLLLARRMVRPVQALREGAERIGAGELASRIEVKTGDELEDLALRFNSMAGQLQESYAGLEKKVEDRTAELREALNQQTATAEILRVISGSPTDVQPVFEAIVTAAKALGNAADAVAARYDGKLVHYVTSADKRPDDQALFRVKYPRPADRSTLGGRAILEGTVVEVADLTQDAEYDPDFKKTSGGYVAGLGVPLMHKDAAIGTLVVWWREKGAIPSKFVRLLQTFADQAVIAIENVRLFNETKESLEQQTAMADILGVISRSPADTQPVLDTIAASATRVIGAEDAGVLLLRDGVGVPVSHYGPISMPVATPLDPQWVTGRAMLEGRTIQVADLAATDEYPESRKLSGENQQRTVLAAPLMREGKALGAIVMRRTEPRPFTDRQVKLIESFAAQAVIAIENVRLFNEIQEKSRQLELANKHKSEFLASMSHELRTPLNAIIGFSDVMLSGMAGPVPEKQKEFTGDIRDSGRHLLGLINDILDLSKIEAGRMELDVAQFDLKGAIDNAMTLVRGRAERHGIRLETEIAPDIGDYEGDERKFKQIVLNLLTNAVKFTPEGGTVTMAAERLDGSYVFSVRDTGIGIAPEDHDKVFEEFRQVGTDYARKAEGTGLGLTLTRKLVELHGGRIRVDSALGKGSTFTFNLPVGRT